MISYRIRATNARGHATTTAYLAYGQPSYDQALVIEPPESVTTAHGVNLFGDITSITQSGPGKTAAAWSASPNTAPTMASTSCAK